MKFGKIETFVLVPFHDLPESERLYFDWADETEMFFDYHGDWMPLSDFVVCSKFELNNIKFHAVQYFSYYNALYISVSDDYESIQAVYAYW